MRLKADLHLHTCEGERFIAYDAKALIARAAREGFRVISITDHDLVTYSEDLREYAQDRGILLIPGVEATIEGKHVLIYNLDVSPGRLTSFAELRRLKRPDWLVVAAHPFFPGPICLHDRLVQEIDLFDGIEFCHFYTKRIDFNRKAVKLAKEVGLPLVGNSDCHLHRQLGTTYSLVEAEPTVDSVFGAIRKGALEIVSRPLPLTQWFGIGTELFLSGCLERVRTFGRHTPENSWKAKRPESQFKKGQGYANPVSNI